MIPKLPDIAYTKTFPFYWEGIPNKIDKDKKCIVLARVFFQKMVKFNTMVKLMTCYISIKI